jgi:methylglutaconyl-CoA hydratase
MRKAIDEDLAANYADTRALTELFSTMNECPKPMIGLIQGAAIGGGVGLVSVCDIVIASKETQFSLSEVRLGIVPACIGPFVIAKIGASRARELFLSAERFDATKAHTIGLVHQLVESPADLAVAGQKVLSNILQASPNAVTIAKRLVLDLSWPERMRQIPDTLEYVSKTLAEIRVTEQGQEGIKAFLEKRKPNWI